MTETKGQACDLMLQVAACWVRASWCTYLHEGNDEPFRMGKVKRTVVWEPELKMSIGWQIMERLLAINGCWRRPSAEFGEQNKTPQNISTGRAFPASMWLCW